MNLKAEIVSIKPYNQSSHKDRRKMRHETIPTERGTAVHRAGCMQF